MRPEGWVNPYNDKDPVFEAGADAMLEALKQEGEYVKNGGSYPCVLTRSLKKGESGWLVFIEEDDGG